MQTTSTRRALWIALASITTSVFASHMARAIDVDRQPLAAQAARLSEALTSLGQPLPAETADALQAALSLDDDAEAVAAIQTVLDPLCLVTVEINPESRVKATAGPAPKKLVQQGWTVLLVKVLNEAGITAALEATSPNAAKIVGPSSGSPDPPPGLSDAEVANRWADIRMFNERPMTPTLSGLAVEYRLIQIFSRDAGKREARIGFDAGQGTQDLGFRSDVDILFDATPATKVVFDVKDEDGSDAMASFLIKDPLGRVYPAQSRRLAPDFFFHPQVYRTTGEHVFLPPGEYQISWTRGPEYLTQRRTLIVGQASEQQERFQLTRWIHLANRGWYSGDHHVHAAGCSHYESPTAGVGPEDMMRHILGEDLNVGCVLSWGPCWYHQKQFFDGGVHPLSTADYVMRYDVEVSGFPSSHAGHLCLLRLAEDDYPGTTRIEEWPSWTLPVLQWGKEQGGVVGFSHSGWGLEIADETIPSMQMPRFDGIGANEYIVDVTHDAVDFLSAVDTPINWELNIWYHTLNCGFRTRISGETDFPCIYGERVGLGRLYVKLDEDALDFDRYVEGIKQGRSYVTDGKSHLFDFRVGDAELGVNGSQLVVDTPGEVTIACRAAALLPDTPPAGLADVRSRPLSQKPYWELERARIGSSQKVPVELLVNGRVVARDEIDADGRVHDLTWQTQIRESSWVAVRIWPSSHTNPIWVNVADKPVRASRDSAQWCLDAVDVCWQQKKTQYRQQDLEAAEAAYNHARETYRATLSETARAQATE
jgi:hypothetical protein